MKVLTGRALGVVCASAFALPALSVTPEYEALRAELRAFYPDECHGPCKLAAQTNSVQEIIRGFMPPTPT